MHARRADSHEEHKTAQETAFLFWFFVSLVANTIAGFRPRRPRVGGALIVHHTTSPKNRLRPGRRRRDAAAAGTEGEQGLTLVQNHVLHRASSEGA